MVNFINKAAWQDALLKEEIMEELSGGGIPVEVSWDDVTDKPAALTSAQAAGTPSIRALGTAATNAAAGNHVHTATAITATAIAPGTATNVQGILGELAARIAALETP